MKRWRAHTISTLWLSVATSGIMSTTVVAATDNFFIAHRYEFNNEAVFLAQAETTLELGSTGSAVRDVQAMLSLMGYYADAVDGSYEQMTVEAVRRFQTDAGLTADGVVGPLTWRRLLPTPASLTLPQTSQPPSDEAESMSLETEASPSVETPSNDSISATAGNLPILRLDDSGDEVSRLQQRLAALNLYPGPIDGVFGEQTEQAVEQFQRQTGLGVDGVVGPATWLELFDESEGD